MLTDNQLLEVKNEFTSLVHKISVDGARLDDLCNYLDENGFFKAPASAQYHCAFEGGLCLHSLNVYDELKKEISSLELNEYTEDDIIIVSLFHELEKMGMYELYNKNEKVYSENGTKYDDMGKYDWVTTKAYKVSDVKSREVNGELGFNSYMILKDFIPLTNEQIIAIVNHNCGIDSGNPNKNAFAVLDKHKLTTLLHCADMICTYVVEK